MKFEGLYTPVITAHRADCEIDRDGVAAMIEHLMDADVHGIVVAGTTGEYYAQTRDGRLMLMDLAHEVIGGRVPIYNYPGRTGVMMGKEFLDIVRRSRNFQAIKESSGHSGFGGRDNGVHAFNQYTQLKTLWIDTFDRELESGIA